MTPGNEFKSVELNRLYDLFWRSSSELDKALIKAKIRMVTTELDQMEMTGASIAYSDRS
jgi:hypothetical protein